MSAVRLHWMQNQLYENSRKSSCYNTVASKVNKILKMKKKIKRNAHRFKINKGLVNSGNGSQPIIDVGREEQTRPRLFSSSLHQYTCKRRANKTVFGESTTWTQRFTVCDSAYMTETNMGPGSNAPALKCQPSHLNSDQPFDRLFFPPWRNVKLFCTTLLFAKARKRFLTSDTEDQPRVFTWIYKISYNLVSTLSYTSEI